MKSLTSVLAVTTGVSVVLDEVSVVEVEVLL